MKLIGFRSDIQYDGDSDAESDADMEERHETESLEKVWEEIDTAEEYDWEAVVMSRECSCNSLVHRISC